MTAEKGDGPPHSTDQVPLQPSVPSQVLFDRNMAMLAIAAPALCARLSVPPVAVGEIVVNASHPDDYNLLIDGQWLYRDGRGARARARQTIADYLQAPTQFGWAPFQETVSPVIDFVRDRVDAIIAARGPAACPRPVHHRAAALVAFGIGSGEEIRVLTEQREFRHVILAELDIRLLWHSLWLQDWARLHDTLSRRGGALHILAAGDPDALATEIYLRLTAPGVIHDGAYYLAAYPGRAIDACLEAFGIRAHSLMGLGYFEDEVIMFVNATRNLMRAPAHFVRNDRPVEKGCPAIIVGAGPSLDRALPHLAALREGAVVFSAGTTLRTLLRHGITPDFQCEIENRQANYEALRHATADQDVSEVCLLAAANVDPRAAGLFDSKMLYLRTPGISADVYGDEHHAVPGGGPNCATLALRMAARFGFREVYLFGTDFGGRRPHAHHVSDSIWMTDPVWRQQYESSQGEMHIEMPGNFGGRAYTSQLLEFFLHTAVGLIAASKDIRFFNCSDGVRIVGAIPKAPAAVRIETTASDRRRAVEQIFAATSYRRAGEMIDRPRLLRFRDLYRGWARATAGDLARLDAGGADLITIHDAVVASLDDAGETGEARGIATMSRGSLAMMLRHALHYALRHDLLDDRGLVSAVATGLGEAIGAMSRAVDEMIGDAAGSIPAPG